jgi:hypothetical protein
MLDLWPTRVPRGTKPQHSDFAYRGLGHLRDSRLYER